MKALIINGSPRGKKSNTTKFLAPFLEGVSEIGVEIELIYLKDKKIGHCRGCFGCWTKTLGKCVLKDDMAELLDKIKEVDMMVYGTPLYKYDVSGLMKDFIDRKQPLLSPMIARIEGRIRHPEISGKTYTKKEVLLVNCGFPERQNFRGLMEMFSEITLGKGHFIGITCGEMLGREEFTKFYAPYREATKNAAREIVLEGKISSATQAVLEKDVIDSDVMIKMANRFWEKKFADKRCSS